MVTRFIACALRNLADRIDRPPVRVTGGTFTVTIGDKSSRLPHDATDADIRAASARLAREQHRAAMMRFGA